MPRPRGGVLGGATRRQRAGGGPEIAKSSTGLILTRFTRALRARSTTVRERPMNRCALSVLAASTVLTVLGCSERERGLPAPQFHDIVVTATSTCDFDAVSHLANHYFSPPLQQLVQDSVGLMQSSGAFTVPARQVGFSIMAIIGAAVSSGTAGDPAIGSSLTNQLILCMFDRTADSASYPKTFPEDFTVPLTSAAHGAFETRGATFESPTAPVFSRPLSSPFSGIAPSGSTWPLVLDNTPLGNPAPNRILVYGQPGSTPQSYDWKVMPRNTHFDPAVVVALCIDPFTETTTTSMVQEENLGILPFVDATFLVPGACSPTTSLGNSWNPLRFAKRFMRLLGPQDLWGNPGGLAGATPGVKSEFTGDAVPEVTLTFIVQPTDTRANQTIAPPVQIKATRPSDGTTVGGVQITIALVNNNGVKKTLLGTTTQTTDVSGVATFGDLRSTDTGGFRLVATGSVVGRPAIVVGQATSARFNVRPAH